VKIEQGDIVEPNTHRRWRKPLAGLTAALLAFSGLSAGTAGANRPELGGPPVPSTDLVVMACNNTFSPAKFPLTWEITSTVVAPTSAGEAEAINPGDEFTMEFDITANLAADFKATAYAIIGPREVPMDQARATIAPVTGATGVAGTSLQQAGIIPVGTGVQGGFTTVNLPAPGRTVTVTWTELSTAITAAPGTFVSDDVGRLISDNGPDQGAGANASIEITAVNGDGSGATLASNAQASTTSALSQIWSPDELTDSPIELPTATGTFTATVAAAPFNATFQLLGNSTYAGNGSTIPADDSAGFATNATTSDLSNGTAIQANTTPGFASGVQPTVDARTTYLRAVLGPVQVFLPCMGGSWSPNLQTVDDPATPVNEIGTTTYGYPYMAPAGFNGTTGGQGAAKLAVGVAYGPASAAGDSTLVAINLNTGQVCTTECGFDLSDVGSPIMGSLGYGQLGGFSYQEATGIPNGAKITAVASGAAFGGGPTAVALIDDVVTADGPLSSAGPLGGVGIIDLVGGFATVNITPVAANVSITAISGQVVTTAARAGNTVTFSGANWTSGGDPVTVALCNSTGGACTATGLDNAVANVDVNGDLTGTVDITTDAATGSRRLVITQGGQSAFRSLLVLTDPTMSSNATGATGSLQNVTGTNWNPNDTTTVVQALDEGNVVLASSAATVGSTGSLNGTIASIPVGTTQIRVIDTSEEVLVVTNAFAINANEQDCGDSDPLDGCVLVQDVYLNIEAGNFTWSQTSPTIVLNSTTTGDDCDAEDSFGTTCFGLVLDGTTQAVAGSLNDVTVIDARGAGAGWAVSAVMTDLTTGGGGLNRTIPASTVTLTPDCVIVDGVLAGGTAQVLQGSAGTLSPTVGRALCSAPVAGAGGTFTAGGDLSFDVPASIYAGLYQSVLTLTAI
jgi:hypothetical protein